MNRLNCSFLFFGSINPATMPLFVIISIILVCLTVYLYEKKFHFNPGILGNTAMLLLVLGAFLNIWERIKIGCVYDYLDFFGIFKYNAADILVTSGIVLAIINIWRKKI